MTTEDTGPDLRARALEAFITALSADQVAKGHEMPERPDPEAVELLEIGIAAVLALLTPAHPDPEWPERESWLEELNSLRSFVLAVYEDDNSSSLMRNFCGSLDERIDRLIARAKGGEAIERAAYKRGWNDRESDIIERCERIAPASPVDPTDAEHLSNTDLLDLARHGFGDRLSEEGYEACWEELRRRLDAATPSPHTGEAALIQEARSIFTDVAQLIDAVKMEWAAEGQWSDWDQGVRDRLSGWLSIYYALVGEAPTAVPKSYCPGGKWNGDQGPMDCGYPDCGCVDQELRDEVEAAIQNSLGPDWSPRDVSWRIVEIVKARLAAPPPQTASAGDEEHSISGDLSESELALLNSMGGYQQVFNAIGDAVKPTGSGLGISVMAFMRRVHCAKPNHPSSLEAAEAYWQPIETAPLDGHHILLAFGQDTVAEGWYDDNDHEPRPWKFVDTGAGPSSTAKGFVNSSRDGEYGPSHWAELPTRAKASQIIALRCGNDGLREAAEALLAKIALVEPKIDNLCAMAFARGVTWDPSGNWAGEVDALRAALHPGGK